jgi:hypothetical protein
MLSKIVPRKSHGFETRVTDNPEFQVLIPLYPESDKTEAEVDKVKVKLRRNPGQTTLPIYGKTYTGVRISPWAGHTVEGYCRFQAMLDKYIQQALLNNVNKRVGAFTL